MGICEVKTLYNTKVLLAFPNIINICTDDAGVIAGKNCWGLGTGQGSDLKDVSSPHSKLLCALLVKCTLVSLKNILHEAKRLMLLNITF